MATRNSSYILYSILNPSRLSTIPSAALKVFLSATNKRLSEKLFLRNISPTDLTAPDSIKTSFTAVSCIFPQEQSFLKSSIISKSLIGSDVIPKQMVLDTLLMVSRRLDQLYEGNRKYNDALKNLASASYLSFIFDYTLDSKILIKYYEKINSFETFCVV